MWRFKMKQLDEMNKKELMNHMFSLISEVQHLKTMLKPHDTGHIHTTIGMLEERIDNIRDCLSVVCDCK
jgi:hypothetical protein